MFRFSRKSKERLDSCHPALQKVVEEALKVSPVDFAVVCGHRSKVAQMVAHQEGRSKVAWPDSKHNRDPSWAVDLGPWRDSLGIPWGDEGPFYLLAGVVLSCAKRLEVPMRWGGAWTGELNIWSGQKFNDLGHFELIEPEGV